MLSQLEAAAGRSVAKNKSRQIPTIRLDPDYESSPWCNNEIRVSSYMYLPVHIHIYTDIQLNVVFCNLFLPIGLSKYDQTEETIQSTARLYANHSHQSGTHNVNKKRITHITLVDLSRSKLLATRQRKTIRCPFFILFRARYIYIYAKPHGGERNSRQHYSSCCCSHTPKNATTIFYANTAGLASHNTYFWLNAEETMWFWAAWLHSRICI